MKQVLLAAMLVFVGAAIYAQTPDEETPANEGVCDDLMGATPGLYGLCIAFCEAQDCDPDFSLDDPLENCNPSSEKLLRNYNRKKTELDPDMPCIKEPCPCWTQEELESLAWPSPSDQYAECRSPAQSYPGDYWRIVNDSSCYYHRTPISIDICTSPLRNTKPAKHR